MQLLIGDRQQPTKDALLDKVHCDDNMPVSHAPNLA